jgi:hypothetical protein
MAKLFINYRTILGYVAMWAVRQIDHCDDTGTPPRLEFVLQRFVNQIRPQFDTTGWAYLTVSEINEMLQLLVIDDDVLRWNDMNYLVGCLT